MATLKTPHTYLRRTLDALRQQVAQQPPSRVRVEGLRGSARALLIWRFLQVTPRPALIIAASAKEAEALVTDLRFFWGETEEHSPFTRQVHYFPAWDVVPFEELSPTAETVAARVEGLYHLLQTKNPVLVTTPDALLQRVPPRAQFAERLYYLVEGEEVDLNALASRLDDWGYRRVPVVEERGDFSVRGGIIDIYPPAHALPLRIDLFGDTIETIRTFDPVTQRSLETHQEFLILPVQEFNAHERSDKATLRAIELRLFDLEVDREERLQILDRLANGLVFPGIEFFLPYFYSALETLEAYLPDETLVWVEDPSAVEATLGKHWDGVQRHAQERAEAHRYVPEVEALYLTPGEWRSAATKWPTVEMETLEVLAAPEAAQALTMRSYLTHDLRVDRAAQQREAAFAAVTDKVQAWQQEGCRVLIAASSTTQVERLRRLFDHHDMPVECAGDIETALKASLARPYLITGTLSAGFRIPAERLVLATDTDIFGEPRQRRRARRVEVRQLLRNLNELKPNDYVVHLDHGVGCYRGLKHLQVADTEGDYLHLEYAGGDRLYLPVDRIGLVQKYSGADGATPVLDKLGGTNWSRVKHKTRESILEMAEALLEVYAAREAMDSKACEAPDDYFAEFEAAFPFEETPDQQRAIDDVLADLQRTKAMDRLICGDVGYGKTEVAIRAAFLTVLSGRQVAVLVPTTVLAQQHYNSFRKRYEGYPVKVALLSRYLTKEETRGTLAGLADGSVDVVIGTHRLFQKDIKFKDLGLLVVDEEHRFGVTHKERIRQMRKLVHVLTLTATPIPRTLQMSLLGIRDLSVIETPPVDRLAIRTYVTRFDEGIIREAITRELSRGGQVFYIYNRVETIQIKASRLREIMPEATVSVAHGQMHERELEQVMGEFFDRKSDVLVCTAIVESGLDVPNANTILIDRADHFGLAQLYQLRGRVGRSHERAYAYLMIPGEQLISRDAQRRLQALQELDDLGGGFKLAAHDLEIRGAGNLLGKQQSGHITAVGFELYQQMMEEAVAELQGRDVQSEFEPEIQLGIPAFLPESYVVDEDQRLVVYRRLSDAKSRKEIDAIADELRDRYGAIPPEGDNFLRLMDLRRLLKLQRVVKAVLRGESVILQFHENAPIDVERLATLVQRDPCRYKLGSDFQLSFVPESQDWDGLMADIQGLLQSLRESE